MASESVHCRIAIPGSTSTVQLQLQLVKLLLCAAAFTAAAYLVLHL